MKNRILALLMLCMLLCASAAFAEGETIPLAQAGVGDSIVFGAYEQDDDESNGKEPIEWLVLERKIDRVLVISRYVLDDQPYHTLDQDATWETCFLRMWLNGHFMNEAFTSDEQARILTTTVQAEADTAAYPGTKAGNNTEDQVFLLSYSQAVRYFPEKQDSLCEPTAYAEAQGAAVPANNPALRRYSQSKGTTWWLRSTGSMQDMASHVLASGGPEKGGNSISVGIGVRPVMWLAINP